MKHNGQNIIFDEDITMTGQFSGEKLSEIIGEQRQELDKLKSNVKWLYKYGGVGGSSGSGSGGGGSASGYVLFASLGGVQLNNQSVAFNGEGNYELYIKITRPNGASFKVTYTYDVLNTAGVVTQATTTVTLNVSNDYEYTRTINLNCNGKITVQAVDSIYSEPKAAYLDYITKSYSVTSGLVNKNGLAYDSNEIYMETAAADGLFLRVKWDIAVNSTRTYCDFSFTKGSEVLKERVELVGSKGFYDFDLSKYVELVEANSGYYSTTAVVVMSLEGQLTDPVTMITSFNLIPAQLYLLVQPGQGSIYTEAQEEGSGYYEFDAGFITLNLRPYQGSNTNATVKVHYYVVNAEGAITNDNTKGIDVRLGSQQSITVFTTSQGHNEIRLKVDGSGTYPTGTEPNYNPSDGYIRYHFYVKSNAAAIDWYSEDRTGVFNYYRLDDVGPKPSIEATEYPFASFNAIASGNVYQQTSNKGTVSIKDLNIPTNTNVASYDTNICIGIQYNEVNSDNSVILSGNLITGNTTTLAFKMTQNTITVGDKSFSYFLPKTRDYDGNDSSKYHLVNLVSRKVTRVGNYDYFELVVYVDGVIEGGSQTFKAGSLIVNELVLGESNCFVNLLEVSYLTATEQPFDLDTYRYYLKYRNTILQETISEYEVELLKRCGEFTLDGNDVFCTRLDVIENISSNLGVPTIVLTMGEDKKDILDASYGENDEINPIRVSVKWATAKGKLNDIEFPTNFGGLAYFDLTVQGSSTKTYKCKNYTLGLKNSDTGETAAHYLFSPNYKGITSVSTPEEIEEACKTFLPEESFTLKADVVDSSHSNNTSIGKFVNDITTKFDTTSYSETENTLSRYTKNCLDGFPCVVYLGIPRTDKNSGTTTLTYYYQGVYNFNLGRESFYNLGYKDESVFCDSNGFPLLTDAGDGFTFFRVESSQDYSIKKGLVVAEIQGNSPYFDFSQWNDSILWKSLDGVEKNNETYMFDDIVTGTGITEVEAKRAIQTMIKGVSKAGGYLFDLMGKSYSNSESDHYGYDVGYNGVDDSGRPLNQVPNYKKHFIKKLQGSNQVFEVDPNEVITTAQVDDLSDLIIGKDGNPEIDYTSLSEYYTICMAFGLVDSVQKNMNMKAWNTNSSTGKAKFYTAFYDMDTCLGINNAGQDVSYFAFSDYWSYDDSNVDSEGTVTPTAVTIYRDFSPKANSAGGTNAADFYDTPSSYLFAVAKYSRMVADRISVDGVMDGNDATNSYPQELWAKWRSAGVAPENDKSRGCLASAEKFMNAYFSNNLGKVGIPMVNLNYRNKYFVQPNAKDKEESNYVSTSYSSLNFVKFNGTRIAKATDWLDGRFHILDAYFNLPKSTAPIQHYDENGHYTNVIIPGSNQAMSEPTYYNSDYNLMGNTDIFVLQDIFAGQEGVNQTAGTLNINVKAKEYSPLIVNTANSGIRYLLGGNDQMYHIRVDLSGNQTYSFYGSGAWTYLDSIDTFGFKTLNVNTRYLETLSGSSSSNSMTLGNIYMPSLKTLALTGSRFTGNLIITGEDFPNLGSVDIRNTGIMLDLRDSTLTNLNIANMKGSEVYVSGCGNLQNVTFGTGDSGNISTTLSSCIISPMPVEQLKKGVTITNSRITNLQLTNTTYTGGKTKLTIQNDTALTTLTVSGISELTVTGCTNLKEIIIADPDIPVNGDPNGDYLTVLTCRSCGNSLLTFKIGKDTTPVGTVDLEEFTHLTNVTIQSTQGMVSCKLPDSVTLGTQAFYNSQSLKYLKGTNIILAGTSIFQLCKAFTMFEEEGSSVYTKFVLSPTLTSLSGMFNVSGVGGSLRIGAARYFINTVVGSNAPKITNITSMFNSQGNIVYSRTDLAADLANTALKGYIDLSGFTNLSSVGSAFSHTGITAIHKKMVSFGSNVSSISFGWFLSAGSRTVYAQIDALSEIINKIDYIWMSNYTSYSRSYITTLCIVDNSGAVKSSSVTNPIKLTDFFHPGGKNPEKVLSLQSFELDPSQYFDLTGTFTTGWNSLTTLYGFLYNNHTRLSGLEGLFATSKITTFYESLRISNENNPVSLSNFINWSYVIGKSANIFPLRSSLNSTGTFTMRKYMSLTEFTILVKLLINNAGTTKLTTLGHIFRNCTVFVPDESYATLSLVGTTKNTTVTSLISMFDGFKMISTGGEEVGPSNVMNFINADDLYITLADSFFAYVPNAVDMSYMFRGLKIANPIPFDFFGKRQVNKRQLFIKRGEEYLPGNLYQYTYKSAISSLVSFFENVKWGKVNNGVNARYFQGDPEGLPHNRFAITEDESRLVEIETVDEADTIVYNRITTPILDPETGEETGEYDVSYASAGKIGSNTELTDLEGLQGDYTYAFDVTLSSGGNDTVYNFVNYAIDNEAVNTVFIAPDFFYGCKSDANVTGCFSNTQDSEETLEGIIPEHLMSACPSVRLDNVFRNLNIIPRYLWTVGEGTLEVMKVFYYVPMNFTQSTSLAGAFNFHLIVPAAATSSRDSDGNTKLEYTKYYVLLDNSISKNITSLSDAFPSVAHDSTSGGILHSSVGGDRWINTYLYDYGIHYNIMYNIANDAGVISQWGSGSDGIDMSYFTSLTVDRLVNANLAALLNGHLFNQGFSLNSAKKTNTAYMIFAKAWTGSNFISRNLILPRATGDWSDQSVFNITAPQSSNLNIWSTQIDGGEQASFNAYNTMYDGPSRKVVVVVAN
jgi:hypothetical protein